MYCALLVCFCNNQYQEEIQELNEVARHRPRSTLVMGIQQENRQIRELQQENKGKTWIFYHFQTPAYTTGDRLLPLIFFQNIAVEEIFSSHFNLSV